MAGSLQLTATITANQDRLAHIAPRVNGKLANVMANLGDRVRAGQVLALVDSIEIGAANAEYLQALSAAELARANLERAEKLNAEQIIAQKDYLAARSEAQRDEAALRAAQDRLRLLGSSVPQPGSRAQSIYALTAPIPGTVIEKHAILGELATPEKTLFAVADLSSVWIEANLFEKDLTRVERGAQATVEVTAYPNKSFRGRLTYISDTVDQETRTVHARVEVANRDGLLKPGMFATANLQSTDRADMLIVPQNAVVLLEGKSAVFVQEGNAYEPRNVQPGLEVSGQVQILSGIAAGDRVVIDGAYELKARLLKSQMGEGHVH
jgi:cobalt-zinc-cadmium efflux system membrane fusion protein